MGSLTYDMNKLCDEISALRDARGALMKDLGKGARDLHHIVSEMQAGFRQSHEEMARETKAARVALLSGLKRTVLDMRRGFSADLAGARRAWLTGHAVSEQIEPKTFNKKGEKSWRKFRSQRIPRASQK